MRRYLIVANQTLGGDHLLEQLVKRLESGPSAFHILVPATFSHEHAFHTEGEAKAIAQRRLDAAEVRFSELGATVTGEVGDINPLYAIEDVLRSYEFDEIILSTLPARVSKWLRLDLPHKCNGLGLPVTTITAKGREGAAV